MANGEPMKRRASKKSSRAAAAAAVEDSRPRSASRPNTPRGRAPSPEPEEIRSKLATVAGHTMAKSGSNLATEGHRTAAHDGQRPKSLVAPLPPPRLPELPASPSPPPPPPPPVDYQPPTELAPPPGRPMIQIRDMPLQSFALYMFSAAAASKEG